MRQYLRCYFAVARVHVTIDFRTGQIVHCQHIQRHEKRLDVQRPGIWLSKCVHVSLDSPCELSYD